MSYAMSYLCAMCAVYGTMYKCIHAHLPRMSGDSVNIRIKRDTWKRLNSRKGPGDSFDDVISRLLDSDEANEGNSSRPATADD